MTPPYPFSYARETEKGTKTDTYVKAVLGGFRTDIGHYTINVNPEV